MNAVNAMFRLVATPRGRMVAVKLQSAGISAPTATDKWLVFAGGAAGILGAMLPSLRTNTPPC